MAINSLPVADLSREEVAKREVGHTTVSPGVVRALVLFFLAAIAAVPIVEAVGERWRASEQVLTAWSRLVQLPAQVSASFRTPMLIGTPSAWKRTVAANRAALAELAAFEDALEDESLLGQTLRPPAQRLLSGRLGAGNERVYVGREGWLFYRPDAEYLTGPAFLDPSWLRRRVASASEWTTPPQPDPREAILDFHRQLGDLGIALVVMPTPVKPAIHPEKLAARYEAHPEPLHNPSYGAFVDDLRGHGVLVFDVAPLLARERQSAPQYLATDTHWRPETIELVAGELAAFVRDRVELPSVAPPGYRTGEREVRNQGDTAVMLDLPAGQTLYPPESVWIRRVLEGDGSPWRSSRDADVLVLGDSFSNIYSLASMGWGDAAGLTEQLSHTLNRPVDRIVQNDDGAFATRAMLQRAGADRLAGKRVVVWQFATRELAFGDWQIIDVPGAR